MLALIFMAWILLFPLSSRPAEEKAFEQAPSLGNLFSFSIFIKVSAGVSDANLEMRRHL